MDQEKLLEIEKALQKGDLSEALKLLVHATRDQEKTIREDAALLQSKFEHHRNQYEIKGILTDQEFNIQYSRTMLGVQDILERLRQSPTSATRQKNDYRILFWLVGLVVLIIAGWLLWPDPADPAAEEEPLQDSTAVHQPLQQEAGSEIGKKPIVEQDNNTKPNPATKLVEPPKTDNQTATTTDDAADAVMEATEKAEDTPPALTFKVNIIRNSNISDTEIYVDGQPATILSNTPIITVIRVTEKSTMHQFELRRDGQSLDCKRERLVTEDNQKVNFNCN